MDEQNFRHWISRHKEQAAQKLKVRYGLQNMNVTGPIYEWRKLSEDKLMMQLDKVGGR
jgi:hypothetical protein